MQLNAKIFHKHIETYALIHFSIQETAVFVHYRVL